MSESLTIQESMQQGTVTMKLVGQIDEDADYSCSALDKITTIIFDFSEVTLVNSTGLQKWVNFLEQIPKNIQLSFEKCPPRIVRQIDMFPGFVGGRDIHVLSFYAPYYCEACDHAEDVLLLRNKLEKIDHAPKAHCSKCGDEMEFDAIEKKYFLFLNRLKSAS